MWFCDAGVCLCLQAINTPQCQVGKQAKLKYAFLLDQLQKWKQNKNFMALIWLRDSKKDKICLGQCVISPLSFTLHSHDSDICIMTSIKLNSLSKYKICATFYKYNTFYYAYYGFFVIFEDKNTWWIKEHQSFYTCSRSHLSLICSEKSQRTFLFQQLNCTIITRNPLSLQ